MDKSSELAAGDAMAGVGVGIDARQKIFIVLSGRFGQAGWGRKDKPDKKFEG